MSFTTLYSRRFACGREWAAFRNNCARARKKWPLA